MSRTKFKNSINLKNSYSFSVSFWWLAKNPSLNCFKLIMRLVNVQHFKLPCNLNNVTNVT